MSVVLPADSRHFHDFSALPDAQQAWSGAQPASLMVLPAARGWWGVGGELAPPMGKQLERLSSPCVFQPSVSSGRGADCSFILSHCPSGLKFKRRQGMINYQISTNVSFSAFQDFLAGCAAYLLITPLKCNKN